MVGNSIDVCYDSLYLWLQCLFRDTQTWNAARTHRTGGIRHMILLSSPLPNLECLIDVPFQMIGVWNENKERRVDFLLHSHVWGNSSPCRYDSVDTHFKGILWIKSCISYLYIVRNISFLSELFLSRLQAKREWGQYQEKAGPPCDIFHDSRYIYTDLLYIPQRINALGHTYYPVVTCPSGFFL